MIGEDNMDINDVRAGIIITLSEIGIFESIETEEDINLQDYLEDSLQFITAIVEIEQYFGIEFPDEYLTPESTLSLNGFSEIIYNLIKLQKTND